MTKMVVAAAAVGTLVVYALVTSGEAAVGPATVRITDVQVSDHLIRPRGGGAIGSAELIRQRLYNPRLSQAPIGRASLTCLYLDKRERSCTGTYVLPRGTVVVTGAIQSRLFYEIAIVGGTGIYDDARGSLTVTSTHLRPRREVLVFRLTG